MGQRVVCMAMVSGCSGLSVCSLSVFMTGCSGLLVVRYRFFYERWCYGCSGVSVCSNLGFISVCLLHL